jgi:Myosin heavy chain
MSLLSKVLLFISSILAFTTLLFFFQFVAERTSNKALIAQKEAFSVEAQKRARLAETQSARTQDAEKMAQKAKSDSIDSLSVASEFKAELERQLAESQVAQKETLARLNARLEREIVAKQKAEKEAEKYFAQKELLEHDLLMVWAEMETLKAEHNKKIQSLNEANAKNLKVLNDEIAALKKELEVAAESIKTLRQNLENLSKPNPPTAVKPVQ